MTTADEQVIAPIDSPLAGGGEMGALMRSFDWSQTPLGPVQSWPRALKTCVRIMLTSRQPMWLGWGDDLTFLYNDPYRSIVGGKHPGALGRPTAVVWREIWADIAPRIQAALGGEEGTYDEALLLIMERHGYPEETYYTFSYSPIPDDDGRVAGIFCANTDDTRRVIGERQLALLRDLAAGTTEARSVEDACALSMRCLESNPWDVPFAALYLLDPDQRQARLCGVTNVAPGHPDTPETLALDGPSIWPLAEVARTNAACLVPDLGSRFGSLPTGAWDRPPAQAVALPVAPSSQGGPVGALIVGLSPYRLFEDDYRGFLGLVAGQAAAAIADARAYEEERKRAEALAELDRAKTVFFNNISHEFRTPLTLMLGPLEDVLASPGDADLVREQVASAHRNSLRLLRLVNTLLDFSRAEGARMEASYEPTDLAALTAELAGVFRAAVERAGLRLVVDCPPLPGPVYVDREMWEKVVLNLLSNAFKFTLEGEIAVTLRAAGGGAALAVRDTGVGIPAGELPHLFERFHRVRGARARTHEGSGIGLALVRDLVALHGGEIGVESAEGVGTTFTVTLPLGTAHLPAERIQAARTQVSTALGAAPYVEEALRWLPARAETSEPSIIADIPTTAAHPAADGTPRARVLLADDNADLRDYLTRLLAGRYEVQAVADGAEALTAALAAPPDLVLSDVMMPELDGHGLVRALRADSRTSAVPVVLLSARAGEEFTEEGLETGADDYLVKPFSARELLARVRAHLELARVRREARDALAAERDRLRAEVAARRQVEEELCRSRDRNAQLYEAERQSAADARARAGELETLLAVLPIGIGIARDPAAADIRVNPAFARMLGIPPDANASLSAPEGERPTSFQLYRQGRELRPEELPIQVAAAEGREVSDMEVELVRDDGTRLSLLEYAAPLYDDAGAVRGSVGAILDITERTRLAQRTHEALGALLAMADSLVGPTDSSGATGEPAADGDVDAVRYLAELARRVLYARSLRIVMVEAGVEELRLKAIAGVGPEEEERWREALAGMRLEDRIGPAAAARLRRGEAVSLQPQFDPLGATRLHFVPMVIGAKMIGYLAVDYEVEPGSTVEAEALAEATAHLLALLLERVRLLGEREEARAGELAQREVNRRMGEFLHLAAHEMRSPLTAIKGALQLGQRRLAGRAAAQRAGDTEAAAQLAAVADLLRGGDRQVARLSRLIDDLLDASRLDAGHFALTLGARDLGALVRGAVEGLRQAHPARSIALAAADDLVPVQADAIRIEQVIINYVTNALKYSSADRPVIVALTTEGEMARVGVRDEGPGLTPEQQARVWERYARLEGVDLRDGTVEAGGGLGLGLYLSRSIVERHGGQVGVTSAPGEGSTFWFTIPIADAGLDYST